MRVLYINSGNLFGGIEVLLVTIARHRALCPEMEPEFAVCFPGKVREELTAAGVPVHVLGAARASRPWTVWRVRRALRMLLRGRAYDAVLCHGGWTLALFGKVVRAARLPLVLWLHDAPAPRLSWVDRWTRWSPPDFTICNSEYTREGLPRLFPNCPAAVHYCPVPLAEVRVSEAQRQAARAEFDTPAGATVVVQVGRWETHKGHLYHLEGLGKLPRTPEWVCWQVGAPQRPVEAAYQNSVLAAAQRLGVADRVRFLGHQADLGHVFGAADIYCQPNVRPEPFGLTFVEALAARLPVVATALGGPKEIVSADCGVLVPPE
jgi:glycosyltransferase involved in cell wall biosynthesis